ncbi:PucR family transcriptional regulator [Alkalicoccobacillus murimartini]|uniref:DNA-binding PucR family transcriptional regulator n=1 Tax=Alkalicoccobacillus murimartini TaxID=171685 RepID=A0ABT9YIU0_9BACI|nr:helix-turn-helix domain-containing protein [Alkalicoccobacillus murimartini]MDQ0207783.1 DNA-binding PucR family transcriptional regulator [Alkalicoccobacillus murimartini]
MTHTTSHVFRQPFRSLEEFAEMISYHLHCPVTIEDANHQLLAYSTHGDGADEARISTIISRRVPEKLINRFWKDGIIPTLNQTRQPVRVPEIPEFGLGSRVAVSIWKHEEVLGYIWVSDDQQRLLDAELELLKDAAATAKKELLKRSRQRKKTHQSRQELLWQLLLGEHTEKIKSEQHLAQVQADETVYISLLVFDEQNEESKRQIDYMVQASYPDTIPLFLWDDRQLVCLVKAEKDVDRHQFLRKLTGKLQERFVIKQKESCCGSYVQGFDSISKSYQEALRILALKKRFPEELDTAHVYQDLGVFKYVEQLDRSNHVHPGIGLIQQYDAKQGTQLYETLVVFLKRDGNMNEVAKLLHVHANTLTYRVKRLESIGSFSLKDPLQRMGLYLDIIMMEP